MTTEAHYVDKPISPAYCAVIITALQLEFTEVCVHLEGRTEVIHPYGTVYERGYFRPESGKAWEILVAETGPGNSGAAVEVERAISFCHPQVIFFVGIAGGLKDLDIGDVVAGGKVYNYESGKEKDGFKSRPAVHEADYGLVQRARAEARSGNWQNRIDGGVPDPSPRAVVGSIAAGEKVVADKRSDTFKILSEKYSDALAVEMEGFGFLQGAYMNPGVPALVVRGISDLIEGKANADQSGSQTLAARHASAFCFEIIAKLDLSLRQSQIVPAILSGPSRLSIERQILGHQSRLEKIEKVLDLSTPLDSAQTYVPSEEHLNSKMDAARDLLEGGHIWAALSQLQTLKSELDEKGGSPQIRVRLEINQGATQLMLGKFDSALVHFEAASRIDPRNVKALANIAQCHLVRKEAEKALTFSQRAFELDKRNGYVTAVYLQALHDTGDTKAVSQFTQNNPWIHDCWEPCLALAMIAHHSGRYNEAEQLARRSLEKKPENPQALELLATSIIVPIESELSKNPPLPWRLPEDTIGRANEAELIYTRSIELLERQDLEELLLVAIANRGTARNILGRYDEALSDYDHVLSHIPNHGIVLVNKGRLLLGIGRPQEALLTLEKVVESDLAKAWDPLAVAYIATRHPKKALHVLLPVWETAVEASAKIRAGELLLEVYKALDDDKSATIVADVLEKQFPASADVYAAVAEWRAEQPDQTDRAIELFYQAITQSRSQAERERISLSLANLFYRKHRFSEAASLYRDLISNTQFHQLEQRYAVSLLNSGARREALKFAQELRASGPAIPVITAIEAMILEEAGDLGQARALLLELVEKESEDPDHRIALAFLEYRRHDIESARHAVSGVAIDEIRGNPDQLMALAKIYAWLSLDGALELAYRARRAGFDRADIHSEYVNLVLNRQRERDSTLDLKAVKPGATVHLTGQHGEKQVFTIVAGLEADLHRGELLPSDPVALKLLDRETGDMVQLKHSDLEEVAYRIDKVESQYVFAFQQTLLNYTTWFPEAHAIAKVEIDQRGIDRMLQAVSYRQAQMESLLALYRSNRLTILMLAQLSGKSIIQTWEGLRTFSEIHLNASTGNKIDFLNELRSVFSTDTVVLELTGLLTLASLGLLEPFRKCRRQVLASRYVLDEVIGELTMEQAGLKQTAALYRAHDRYVLEEASTVNSDQRQKFLESVAAFLDKEVELCPSPELLDLPAQGPENPLGRTSLASILIAKENGAPLYSDDFVLRIVARNSWGVAGFWSQPLLLHMARGKWIAHDDYRRAIIDLILANYSFVTVNQHDLLWFLAQEGIQMTPRFLQSLRTLEGPDCSEDSAVRVVGELIREIFLRPEYIPVRQFLLDACITTLRKGRHPNVVLARLQAHVRLRLGFNPQAVRIVEETIKLWGNEGATHVSH
jgi:nucleoside phosphorylase/transcription elongation GreA/GreB family factor/thioredoxin-like negative regulator of GroEL